MPDIDPLPFRIRVPGVEAIDLKGIRDISYKIEGLLHLHGDTLEFEWTATETIEQVSFTKIGTDREESPIGRHEE